MRKRGAEELALPGFLIRDQLSVVGEANNRTVSGLIEHHTVQMMDRWLTRITTSVVDCGHRRLALSDDGSLQ